MTPLHPSIPHLARRANFPQLHKTRDFRDFCVWQRRHCQRCRRGSHGHRYMAVDGWRALSLMATDPNVPPPQPVQPLSSPPNPGQVQPTPQPM